MRRIIQFLSLVSFFAVAVLISGELFCLYSADFSEYPYWETSPHSEVEFTIELESAERVFGDLGLRWFAVLDSGGAESNRDIDIFCNEEVRLYLEKEGFRKPGRIQTLFHGCSNLRYHEWSEFAICRPIPITYRLYICEPLGKPIPGELYQGDDGLKRAAGDFSKLLRIMHRCLWILTGAIVVLLSALNAHLKKKEWLIRRTYGFSCKYLFCEAIATEISMVLLARLFAGIILYRYSATRFQILMQVGIVLGCTCIVCFIHYFNIFHMDHKAAMQRSLNSNNIAISSELLRIVLFAASVVIVSCSYAAWNDYKAIKQQERFYTSFQGYSHLQLAFEDPDGIAAATAFLYEDSVYSENYDKWNTIQWKTVTILAERNSYQGIYANRHAFPLLQGALQGVCDEEKSVSQNEQEIDAGAFYMFLPDTLSGLSENELESMMKSTAGLRHESERVVIEYYRADIEVYAFCGPGLYLEQDACEIVNPILLFDAEEDFTPEVQGAYGFLCDFSTAACKINETELRQYILQSDKIRNGFLIDIYETYQKRMASAKERMKAYLIIGAIMIAINLMMLILFIRMKQQMDAVQYAVLRVTGSPFLMRHRDLIRASLIAAFIGAVVAMIITELSQHYFSVIGLVIAFILVLLDLGILTVTSHRWEKMSLIRVLKGGAL